MCLSLVPDGTCMWVEHGRGKDVSLLVRSRKGRGGLEEQAEEGEDEEKDLGIHRRSRQSGGRV